MKGLLFIFCIFLCGCLFSAPIYAVENSVFDDFSEELSALYEVIPDEIQQQLGDVLHDSTVVETLREEMDLTSLLVRMRDTFADVWPSTCSLLLRLFGLLLFVGVFSNMQTALHASGTSDAVTLCTTMCLALAMTGTMDSLLTNVVIYMNGLTELVSGMTPIVCAVQAASGQITTATVSHTSLMLLFTLLQNIANVLLIPLVRVCYCFGIVSTIGGPIKLECMTKSIRKVLVALLSFLSLVFVFVVSVQTALAKGADSLSTRTVKFALGNVIPLIGSALAEAVTTVTSSLTLIRSVTGSLGILALVLLFLPMLMQLILYRLTFSICKGAAEVVGCDREARLIGEMHGTVGFLLAMVGLMTVLFLFILSLFTLIGGGSI